MMYRLLLVALCATIVAHGNTIPEPDAEELEADVGDEERMMKYEVLAEVMKRTFFPQEEQDRDDKCIPEGHECYFWGGPNCCGIETRCYYWGYQGMATRRGGPANWKSICKKYNAGIWMKSIGDFFSNLG